MLHELAEMAELGAVKGRCQKGYRRVKNPQGQFVCIPKQPCPPTHRFNAKQFACVPKKGAQRRPVQGGGAVGPGFENVAPPVFDAGGGGFDTGGDFLPGGDIYVPPVAGQPYPYPPVGGQPCTNAYGQPSTIDPVTGICMLTGQQVTPGYPITGGPSALYPWGSPGQPFPGQPFPGYQQPTGPSALYPFGGPSYGGGFQPAFGGGGPVQFDQVPGGGDFDTGGGDDFIPSDAQMNLTPPGMPQAYGPMPGPVPVSAEAPVDETGGTDQEAYGGLFSNWFGMEGLGEDVKPTTDAAKIFSEFSDIALSTAERAKNIFGKRGSSQTAEKPMKQPVERASSLMPILLAVAGAGLGVLAYRAIKKK